MRTILRQKTPLIALVVWCVALLVVRFWYARSTVNAYLLWNMLLAVVPLVASSVLRFAAPRPGLVALKVAAFMAWLAFLPNAPYLATDFIHLSHGQPVPLWFDVAVFGSYAATGVLIGYAAVADVDYVLAAKYGRAAGTVFAFGSLLLCGFGIYLGRMLRWNSWDLVTSPWTLGRQIVHLAAHPISNAGTWEVSAVYGVGLVLGYVAIRSVALALGGQELTPARVTDSGRRRRLAP